MGLADTEAGPKTAATDSAAIAAAPSDMRMMFFCLDKDCFLGCRSVAHIIHSLPEAAEPIKKNRRSGGCVTRVQPLCHDPVGHAMRPRSGPCGAVEDMGHHPLQRRKTLGHEMHPVGHA